MTSKIAAIANYAHQVFHNLSSHSLASLVSLAASGYSPHLINSLAAVTNSNRGTSSHQQNQNNGTTPAASTTSTGSTVATSTSSITSTTATTSPATHANSSQAVVARNNHNHHVNTAQQTHENSMPLSSSSASNLPSSAFSAGDPLGALLSKMHSLTKKDVGFDHTWVTDTTRYPSPIVYVHIAENQVFSLGIFVLRAGSRIPLHDHPGMFGLIKVLHGTLRCRSYSKAACGSVPLSKSIPAMSSVAGGSAMASTASSLSSTASNSSSNANSNLLRWQMKGVFMVKPHQDVILNADSGVWVLTPHVGNFHEIYPVGNEGAAFVDILAPPYDMDLGTRECHFYEVVDTLARTGESGAEARDPLHHPLHGNLVDQHTFHAAGDEASHLLLREVPTPRDYICEAAEYGGPSVD